MKPIEGTMHYGVHKDLTGDMIDDPATVTDTYEFVQMLGEAFKREHPELELVGDQVVDVVFVHPATKLTVQRVEWQALMKEKTDA